MKIKIIDLLNLVYNKGNPRKILYKYCEYEFNDETNDYKNKVGLRLFSYLFQYENHALLLEVEIIEEEKEIEKITLQFSETQKEKNRLFKDKLNELVDEINKLKQCKTEVIEGYRVGKVITYNGFEWYIIEEKKESIVLFMKEKLSEELIYDVRFSKDEKNNDWKDSHIRQVLNTKFLEKFITDDLVLMKTKYDDDKTSDDYIRLITIDELKKLDSNIRKVKCNYGYWTMSPGNFNSGLAEVYEFYLSGTYIAIYSSLVTGRSGVRPIIEVRKNAIGG